VQLSKAVPLLALALGVVALVMALCESREPVRPPLEPVLTSEEAVLRDKLKYQGRGLDQPVMVRSFGSSRSEQCIENAARQLRAQGFRIVTHLSGEDDPWGPKDTWTLFADTEMVPSPRNLCSLRDRVKHLMESESVRYDGWGPPGQP
jgi:hypothetical protein